jgi:hypothetical protein
VTPLVLGDERLSHHRKRRMTPLVLREGDAPPTEKKRLLLYRQKTPLVMTEERYFLITETSKNGIDF